jgi:hypothetical protein
MGRKLSEIGNGRMRRKRPIGFDASGPACASAPKHSWGAAFGGLFFDAALTFKVLILSTSPSACACAALGAHSA